GAADARARQRRSRRAVDPDLHRDRAAEPRVELARRWPRRRMRQHRTIARVSTRVSTPVSTPVFTLVLALASSAHARPASDEPTAAEVQGAPLPGEESGRIDQAEDDDSAARQVGRAALFVPRGLFEI